MLGSRRQPSTEETNGYKTFTEKYNLGKKHISRAVEIEEKGSSNTNVLVEACENYKEGIRTLKDAIAVNVFDCPAEKRTEVGQLKEKADGYIKSSQERFLQLTEKLGIKSCSSLGATTDGRNGAKPATSRSRVTAASRQSPARAIASSSSTRQLTPRGLTKAELLKGVDVKFGEALLDEMLEDTGVRLDDVAGSESAKAALEEAVILPAINPSLFSGLRQPVKGILLFGPPGNGKTMLAKAVAAEAGQVFLNITASNLTSKWVGDAEKTVRCLFQIARNAQPAIIFIDEIDSILCERSAKEADSSRRLKTEFLVQFDGATSSADDRILVIGATNRPHELDDAVLRRFPKRIMLGLPDDKARAQLLKVILRKHKESDGLSDSDMRHIASRTAGYSNSDLVQLCKEAAMAPIRSIDRKKLADIAEAKIRPMRVSDFEDAMRVIRPSTNERILADISEFARKAGQAS